MWILCPVTNVKIGIADTTFARVDMAKIAIHEFEDLVPEAKIVRYTVPGVKDLPIACKILIERHACDGVLCIGMPGPEEIDKMCAHEASTGIIATQLMTNKHILEVFIHEDEADTPRKLLEICNDRAAKHARNLVRLLNDPKWLISRAGQGLRQGHPDAGPIS